MDKKTLGKEWRNVSLSSATMRNEDLIPTFFRFLKEHDKAEAKSILRDYPLFEELATWTDGVSDSYKTLAERFYGSEEADLLCDNLFTELDAIAPAGCLFGAHEGDGSDYGFWEYDND